MNRVIALGFFDGVHIGHGALLKRTAETADALGVSSCALTFDGHPEGLITGRSIPLLGTVSDRAGLIRSIYGIREVIVARFDQTVMHTPWQEFARNTLAGEYGAVHVVAGHDFHFGYRGEGNPRRLKSVCAEMGIGCDIIPRIELDGITVSSTYIRKLIAQGELELASRYLGHPHRLTGVVSKGRKIGTAIGFPTVNISLAPNVINPAFGVYLSEVETDRGRYAAVTNVGVRPTVTENGQVTVESTLLGFSGDLYGTKIAVDLIKRLRGEIRFESLDGLKEQISLDIKAAERETARRGGGKR